MTAKITLASRFRALAADRSGNFAMFFALASLAMAFAATTAVDMTRAYGDRGHLQNALDAALLATAKAISTDDIAPAAAGPYLQKVFAANAGISPDETGGYRISAIVFDEKTETLTATATYDYKAAFGVFGDAGNFPISITAGASYGGGQDRIEIAMTFDVTGSMGETVDGRRWGTTKLQALQGAANMAISQLLALNKNGKETVRIAAIPYAEAVNVGSLSRYVYPDNGGPDDDAPRYDPAAPLPASHGGVADCATERKSEVLHPTSRGPEYGMVNRDGRLTGCPSAELVQLTGNASRLSSAISRFRAGGTTAGHIGIQWAWYTLSADWARYMTAGPAARPDDGLKKYAVIMTDGEFNTAYAGVSRRADVFGQDRKSSDYALRLCNAMKAEGIDIFTIGFALDQREARETLKKCASPPKDGMVFYHEASTGDELADVYSGIAAMIRKLRLVY